ncbi:MAG TPA: diadenylate cyclase CdaA [Candidatus Ornithospirochaeta avicola]|uniref:Diadenylate cyclase n=1 Tax=Candidatus Ornithospirochaeta avicola TaxID=2840896 RepID=A0A9D1TMS0_9SPIO|nr:diadenylate cyclase CdaA [Candidatus Ornithospirochaeta avicola]
MIEVLTSLSWIDYLRLTCEILILAFVFYRLYIIVSDTKARQIIFAVLSLGIAYFLFSLLHFDVLTMIIEKAFLPFLILLVVFYHQELRRAFSTSIIRRGRFFRIGSQTTADQIDSILNACNILVEKKRGALIVFPRHIDIKSVLDSGTRINADLSSTLLLTIFDHDTPLHDGAAVVEGGRITYAACYLPLSEQSGIKASFGTRHRAALGLAENSDAIVLVVSEETGAISLAYNANIYYDLSNDTLKRVLLQLFAYHDVLPSDINKEGMNEAE